LSNVEPMRQRLIIKRIASLLRIDEDTVIRSIPKTRRRPDGAMGGAAGGAAGTARAAAGAGVAGEGAAEEADRGVESPRTPGEQMIACALCDGALLLSLEGADRVLVSAAAMGGDSAKAIAGALWEISSRGETPGLSAVLLELHDTAAVRCATAWQQETERLTQGSAEVLHQHWRERLEAARRASRDAELERMLAGDGGGGEPEVVDEDGWSHTLEVETKPSALSALLKLREHASEDGWNPTRVPKRLSG
jgi:hypothetical protein